jgi:hypothetical protein
MQFASDVQLAGHVEREPLQTKPALPQTVPFGSAVQVPRRPAMLQASHPSAQVALQQ